MPSGLVSLNCGGGFTEGPGADVACRGAAGARARAVTLLGGGRVGYLRAAAPAAPAAFELEEPMVAVRGLETSLLGLSVVEMQEHRIRQIAIFRSMDPVPSRVVHRPNS